MSDESTNPELTCWFCSKGKHKGCMKKIPINPHHKHRMKPEDCSFDVDLVDCQCHLNEHR